MQRLRKLLKSNKPLKWLFAGDSITHGAFHTFNARDYTEIFSERIRYEMGRGQDIVIKTALSGNTTRDLLRDFDWRLGQFRPRVVFLMIGMNDCCNLSRSEFRRNLTLLCRKMAALPACLPVFQTTCPILPGAAPDREPHFDAFMDTLRDVARERKLPLIDHTRCWRQAMRKNPDVLYYRMGNAFHPNPYGHQAFATLIFKQLGIHDPRAPTARFFQP